MTGTECNGESCCSSIVLPAGSMAMGRGTETCATCVDGCPSELSCYAWEDPEHPATLTSFALDKYEVTVGRFRAFVAAGGGTQLAPPSAGDGAHPLVTGSGWNLGWVSSLPADSAALLDSITCEDTSPTWTATPGGSETYPMNCVDWYQAFAFCAWDGGRLPTEAEWEFAAAGGSANRVFPWGDDTSEPLPANYSGAGNSPFVAVGSHPGGRGRWGHEDLAGSLAEWTVDWYANDWYTTTQAGCADCVNLTETIFRRVTRGGSWSGQARHLRAAYRDASVPTDHHFIYGWRCSRTPQ